MIGLESNPTQTINGFKVRSGKTLPFGATILSNTSVNFSIYTRCATSCELVLFNKRDREPVGVIPFPEEFRIGNVYSIVVFDLDFENVEYAYRMDGPYEFPNGGHRYDKTQYLMDPYAKAIGGRDVWGQQPDWQGNPYQHRSRIYFDDFIWEGDKPLEIPLEDLVIYETHVRGYTIHESSGVRFKGTYAGLREKIPYLKELGINCIELMPIHEFDEWENARLHPETGQQLMNYWGYSSLGFFAPKAGYAASGAVGMQVDELKSLVKELHANGIEVMLDVVFNHTAEGNDQGPYISYKGIDNQTYYMLTPEGYYYNYSGTGNTMNCNNPIVRNMILDCLRHWAAEYHIDGFRFDLASILGRDPYGAPMSNPPLLESLAYDPVLGKCKLIAEAWDAGGLYQVGSFPNWGRWAEWNGKYRDDIRRFIKGEEGMVGAVAQRLQGSPDLYQYRGSTASINFVIAHDGFTLMDLFSYNGKHNDANGENNNDGDNDNESWNCGWEGESTDPGVNFLRKKQVKNVCAMLMTHRGTPMILAGDEMGRTQYGNNNAYCQDNELSWIDWNLLEQNADLYNFFKKMIAFRNAHPVLRGNACFQHAEFDDDVADISLHGQRAWSVDWSDGRGILAFMLNGDSAKCGSVRDNTVYVAMNMHWEMHGFELPRLADGAQWHVFANTDQAAPNDIWDVGAEPLLENQYEFLVGARSVVVLIAK